MLESGSPNSKLRMKNVLQFQTDQSVCQLYLQGLQTVGISWFKDGKRNNESEK